MDIRELCKDMAMSLVYGLWGAVAVYLIELISGNHSGMGGPLAVGLGFFGAHFILTPLRKYFRKKHSKKDK